jgi:hypothetical protein
MYRRFGSVAAACLLSALLCTSLVAQTKPAPATAPSTKPASAPSTTPPPAAPAKFVPQVKGEGTVDFVKSKPRRVGGEIVTTMKLKNTSKGSLGLLSVEEIWYNTKRQIASNGVYRHRALLNPGDVIEFEIKSKEMPDLYSNLFMFKHANGTVKATEVKKIQ